MCDSYQGAIEGPSFFSLGLSALCFIICCLFLNRQGQRTHKYSCPSSHLSLMLIEKTQQPQHHQVHFLFFVCMWGKGSSSLFVPQSSLWLVFLTMVMQAPCYTYINVECSENSGCPWKQYYTPWRYLKRLFSLPMLSFYVFFKSLIKGALCSFGKENWERQYLQYEKGHNTNAHIITWCISITE